MWGNVGNTDISRQSSQIFKPYDVPDRNYMRAV